VKWDEIKVRRERQFVGEGDHNLQGLKAKMAKPLVRLQE